MADAFKYMLAVNNQQIPVGYNMPNPHLSHPNFPNETKLPWGYFRPNTNGAFDFTSVKGISDVAFVDPEAVVPQLDPALYNRCSIMSTDGLFSPVSFYPNRYSSTFAMTQHTQSKCPHCLGTRKIRSTAIQDPVTTADDLDTSTGGNELTVEGTYKNIKDITDTSCPFCAPDDYKTKLKTTSTKPSESIPPYILTQDSDEETIAGDDRKESIVGTTNYINRFTLNPIVMQNGEFSCESSKQEDDACVHSIECVGFGEMPPGAKGDVRGKISAESSKNYNENDLDYLTGKYQSNQRFIGLRGPLVVHGWGYDQEGYPVPNSSGEYQYNVDGTIRTTKVDNVDVPLYKNQKVKADGSVTKPFKERTFYKGWAATPSTWPVGPVDLRWDDAAGVWTTPGNYKKMWVTIELNLADANPVRGTIDDYSSDAEPLPDGFRKVVYVRDSGGLIKAPRGAALYCEYDADSGFYQPLYNSPFITTGTIKSNNTVDIDGKYTLKYNRSKILDIYEGEVFDNPLNYPVTPGKKAIFSYIGGQWTLTSIR